MSVIQWRTELGFINANQSRTKDFQIPTKSMYAAEFGSWVEHQVHQQNNNQTFSFNKQFSLSNSLAILKIKRKSVSNLHLEKLFKSYHSILVYVIKAAMFLFF